MSVTGPSRKSEGTSRSTASSGALSVLFVLIVFVGLPGDLLAQNGPQSTEATGDTEYVVKIGEFTVSRGRFESRVEGMFNRWMEKFRQSNRTDTPDLDRVRNEIRRKLRDRYVNRLVLKHAIKQSDVSVPDTVVQQRWDKGVKQAGSEKEFRKRLKRRGLTRDTFLRKVRKRLKKRRFLNKHLGALTVSDSEVRSFYDNNKEDLVDKPLETLRPRIRRLLKKRKRDKKIGKLITELKTKAPVSINIPGLQ